MSARSLVLALVLAVSGIGGSAKAALIQVNSLPVQLTNRASAPAPEPAR